MMDVIARTFDPSGFPRRWDCGDWSDTLGWLHIVSDLGIWGAYLAIPFVLLYFAHGRKNLPFRGIFTLFGAFILACGATHLLEAVIFWRPVYRFAGLLKFMTACISWATVFSLVWVTPRALRMRSPEELEREILERRKAEREAARFAERLQATNQKLIESEQQKSNLIARVSHELRTPLTLILSPVESLLAGEQGQLRSAERTSLRTVHNNAVRLLQMVTGLLDLSKLDSGEIEVKREPIQLTELTQSILHDFHRVMEQRSLSVRFRSNPETMWVAIDRYLYERIVFNLLSNAVKFTPAGGSIAVELNAEGDRVRLAVSDTGIGVADQDLPYLFEKYRQVDSSSTRRFEGTGLGLALVKEFAGLLGGAVSVTSTLGKGSTFAVELLAQRTCAGDTPTLDRPHALPTRRYSPGLEFEPELPPETGDKPRVLVAEDNPELAAHIAELLRPTYAVAIASDGERALEIIREWSPDLVLSDVMMPRRDGLDLCKAIKTDPCTSRVPVILLTALIQREALMRGWEVGADEYLFKPFHPRELLTRVRTLLSAAEERHRVEIALANMSVELERRVRERTAELAAIQADLKQADRQKDEFVATLAHELRNPLSAARNCILVVKEAPNEPALAHEFLAMADRQTEQMSRLLDDLLDVTRIRQGKISLKRRLLDLGTLVAQVVADRRILLNARAIRVEVIRPENPLLVSVDPVRIEQIVGNLLDNAVKFSEEGTAVEIHLERDPANAIMRICDQGTGIPPDRLEHIFDLFVQEPSTGDRRQTGIGIGLTLARKLVELHGGSISATSPGIGQGSEFTVRLPIATPSERILARPNGKFGHVKRNHERHRVLVVDDNIDSARSLAMLLGLVGQDVRSAYDGESAIELARDFKPELVLLDIGMPGMDGYEVCRTLRTKTGLASETIVALTGWGQDEDRNRSMDAGFSRHLVKPVEPDAIHDLLARLDERANSTQAAPAPHARV